MGCGIKLNCCDGFVEISAILEAIPIECLSVATDLVPFAPQFCLLQTSAEVRSINLFKFVINYSSIFCIEGLFNQAVIMSGSILSSWAITDYPIASTYQLTEALQCRLLFNRANDCLANATTDEILLSVYQLINYSPLQLTIMLTLADTQVLVSSL